LVDTKNIKKIRNMHMLDTNKVGMAVGWFFALAHLAWAVLVLFGWAKPLLDWVLSLHSMSLDYSMSGFRFGTTLVLVIFTFVVGYVFGWVFAAVWNASRK